MSVTFGFYNSYNHDRRYNAIQMSSIFDGIITDGIFMTIGDCLRVKANGKDMMLTVGIGRAWFNHTWTLNDALLPLELPQSEVILNRIDAVVLEVNGERNVRANTIKIVKGTPSSNPVRPTMVNTNSIHQYPLAFINVVARTTSVRQADVTNMVGSGSAPYITSPLKSINIEDMVAQWEDQWKAFYEKETKDISDTRDYWKEQWRTWFINQASAIQKSYEEWEQEWDNWYDKQTREMMVANEYWKSTWHTWFHNYVNNNTDEMAKWRLDIALEFQDWWNQLKELLNENCCAKLAEAVIDLRKRCDALEQFRHDLLVYHSIYDDIMDNGLRTYLDILDDTGDSIRDFDDDPIQSRGYSSETILDSMGSPIQGRIVITIV